jgi:hypothetical protein
VTGDGAFDRLRALLSVRLSGLATAHDDRDDWEIPVDHVVRALFATGTGTPHDANDVTLARQCDDLQPPEYPSAERIANVVASATRLYAGLAGMYGDHRLFDRVVNTARSNALLSHIVASLMDILCAEEARTMTGSDSRSAALLALENRLVVSENRSRVLLNRSTSACSDCQRSRNEVADLHGLVASLEIANTALTAELVSTRADRETLQQELKEQRDEQSDTMQRVTGLRDTVARQAQEIKRLRERVKLAESRSAPKDRLTRDQATHVYRFCWQHAKVSPNTGGIWSARARSIAQLLRRRDRPS